METLWETPCEAPRCAVRRSPHRGRLSRCLAALPPVLSSLLLGDIAPIGPKNDHLG